jgi:tetratricopeptide (TPR) repeat protein
MTVWPGEVDALVDGVIFSQHEISQQLPTRLGLGRGRYFKDPTALRFHRFRIRKIPYAEVIPVPVLEMDTYGQTVIDFDPEGPEGYFYKVQGLIAKDQMSEGISILEAAIPRVPYPAGLYTQLASLYFFEKNYSEAARCCREVLKVAPMPRESAYLAMILAAAPDPQMRNLEEAQQHVGRVRADADWMGTCALATLKAAQGDIESAKRSIEPADSLAPDERAKAIVRLVSEAIHRGEVPVLPTKNSTPQSPGEP